MRGRGTVAILIAAALLLTGCQKTMRNPESVYTPTNTGLTDAQAASDEKPTPAAAVNAGLTASQPYTIVVLGDSTGNNTDEWVDIIAARIAADYNRTVTVHNWSIDTNSYVDTSTYGKPDLPPVAIWNGSASGKGPDYSKAYLRAMAPERADLTFINHGHNGFNIYKKEFFGENQLLELAKANSTPRGVVAVILQNPRMDSRQRADVQQRGVDQLRRHFMEFPVGVAVIDVNAAFPHDASLATFLRPDRLHPNAQGQKIWVDTVAAVLQLR